MQRVRVVHHVEDEAEFGEDAAHQLSMRALLTSATSSRWKWILAVETPFQSPSRASRSPSATARVSPSSGNGGSPVSCTTEH